MRFSTKLPKSCKDGRPNYYLKRDGLFFIRMFFTQFLCITSLLAYFNKNGLNKWTPCWPTSDGEEQMIEAASIWYEMGNNYKSTNGAPNSVYLPTVFSFFFFFFNLSYLIVMLHYFKNFSFPFPAYKYPYKSTFLCNLRSKIFQYLSLFSLPSLSHF